jgi:predicted MFS family arabinose efflux permease
MTTASVWRSRDFRLVLVGGLINNIGDWLLAVALPAFVYTETGSGRSTAVIVVIGLVIGIAFGPYGGSLADRWDLRRTIISTNVLQALALLPLLAVDGQRIWPAYIVAALQGLLQCVNDPASFALVPRIVAPDQLTQANSANAASGSIARLVGSPLGGIAVVLGGLPAVVIADGATFLAVALATSFVRTPTGSIAVDGADGGQGTSARDGWRAIRRDRPLVGYLVVQTLASLTFAMFPVLFIVFVIDVLGGNEATVGLIRGMAAFGGLAAAALIGRAARNVAPTTLMAWGYAGLGGVALLFVNLSHVTTALWIYFLLFALSGLPNITSQVGATGAAQRLCPASLLGRFQGIIAATSSIGAIVGSVLVGVLIDGVGVRVLLNLQAVFYVLCGVLTFAMIGKRVAQRP